MMKIYGRKSSINVQKVLWCLAELGRVEGRDYERIDAGMEFGVNNTPEYLKMNPMGLVPLLIEDDFILWESNAIVRYLAASANDNGLCPSNLQTRAESDRWMDWASGTLWATLRIAFLGLTRTAEDKRDMAAIAKAWEEGTNRIKILDDLFSKREFCTGDRFTMGDVILGVTVHRWMTLGEKYVQLLGPKRPYPALEAWYRRVVERPAFKQVYG
jgi:glutathione S-transferase